MNNLVECPACQNGFIETRPVHWATHFYSRSIYMIGTKSKEEPNPRLRCPFCRGSKKVPQEHAAAFALVGPAQYTFATYQWLKELCEQLGIKP